jgi:hypothetical protein
MRRRLEMSPAADARRAENADDAAAGLRWPTFPVPAERRRSRKQAAGTPTPATLEWFFDQITPQQFVGDFLDQRPMHLRGRSADHYDQVMRWADLDLIFGQSADHLSKYLLTTKEGQPYPDAANAKIDRVLMLREAFAQGYTIVLRRVEECWLPLARMTRALGEWLNTKVVTTLFLSPPGNQGFARHFDTFDFFVLQIAGDKEWRLFDSDPQLPVHEQWYALDPSPTAPPTRSLTLRRGDLLYLPRGVPHDAVAGDTATLHLTVSFRPYLWRDFLVDLIDEATDSRLSLRRAATMTQPPGGATAEPPELVATLLNVLGPSYAAAAIERERERVTKTLAPLPTALFARRPVRPARAADRFERVAGSIASLRRSRDVLVLSFPGDALRVPLSAEAALGFMARAETVFDLRAIPGGLSQKSKLVLVNQLINCGFLRIVAAAGRNR